MLRPLLLAVTLVAVAGCDSTNLEAQRQFETTALLSPVAGLTRTDANGRVTSTDAADWQIGPSYLNTVTVFQVPFPNPVTVGERLRFSVDVVTSVRGGIEAVVLTEDPRTGLQEIQPIADPGADCPAAARGGVCQFVIAASQLGVRGPGLYRILLVDGADGIVSYGDVEVR